MLTYPSAELSERRLSVIDRFCMQVYQAAPAKLRSLRVLASTLAFVCLVLVACLGVVAWRAEAMEQERDGLLRALSAERAARIEATLAAKDVERDVANYA